MLGNHDYGDTLTDADMANNLCTGTSFEACPPGCCYSPLWQVGGCGTVGRCTAGPAGLMDGRVRLTDWSHPTPQRLPCNCNCKTRAPGVELEGPLRYDRLSELKWTTYAVAPRPRTIARGTQKADAATVPPCPSPLLALALARAPSIPYSLVHSLMRRWRQWTPGGTASQACGPRPCRSAATPPSTSSS